PLLGAGPLRDPRVLAPPRGLPAEAAGGRARRRATGRANLLRGGPQERVDPAAGAGARGGPVRPARGSRRVRLRAVVLLLALLAVPASAAPPLAHREVLPNGAGLLVAERPAIPPLGRSTSGSGGAVP